LKRLKLHHFC